MKLSGAESITCLGVLSIKIQPANRIWNISKIKLQKSIRWLFKGKPFLINNPFYLYTIHISIATYNVAWGSTYMTNLKELSSQPKHAMGISCNKSKFEHTKQLFPSNKILNVYKLNIVNVATFMHKVNPKTALNIFLSRFQKPSHSYPTRFSEFNYVQPTRKIKTSKYSNSFRGPYIWNKFLSSEEKQITTMHKFKTMTKLRLLFLKNDLAFF